MFSFRRFELQQLAAWVIIVPRHPVFWFTTRWVHSFATVADRGAELRAIHAHMCNIIKACTEDHARVCLLRQ